MSVRTPMPVVSGIAAPLMHDNIDTDIIIPSREIRTTTKNGLAEGMFAGWRYTDIDARVDNPNFVLNQPRYAGASILLTGSNFGCGSSREHAVWALHEYGFRAVIAPSFNAIFYGNCIRNSIAAIVQNQNEIEAIIGEMEKVEPRLEIDLVAGTIRCANGAAFSFTMPEEPRSMLVHGHDAIDLTLAHDADIAAHRVRAERDRPWMFTQPT